jgi:peptidoglycan/xylan/chitin deacetylase (PgdA/CDA1 family)
MDQVAGAQPNPVMPPFDPTLRSRLAKLALSSVYYAARELVRLTRRLMGSNPPAEVVAIYYHQVPREQRDRFARQMDHLLRWAMPIRADEIPQMKPGRRYVMVTADDGWLSFIENALPELESRAIPVTIFAIPNYLGDSLGQPRDRLATEEELKGIASDLVCVGSHTSTHARLTTLDEDAAWSELEDSRSALEDILNTRVTLFSFPFGAFNDALVNKCREVGYRRVFLALPPSTMSRPEFVIGRIRVDPTDWRLEFHLKLTGAYGWLPRATGLKRRLLSLARVSPRGSCGQARGCRATGDSRQ